MKTRSTICLFFLTTLLSPLLRPAVAAQQVSASGQSVTCESNDGGRQYCGGYDPRQVKLQRQISTAVCAYNQSWGVDRRGLWVDRGCRAIFSIDRGSGGPGWVHPDPGNPWPPSGGWNGGNWGRGGACFYTSSDFGGDYFCMRRGENKSQLGGYGDQISSIRVFGGARVTVFNDRNYRNGHDTTTRDVADLRSWRLSSRPSNTWNNRISSLQVK